MIAFISGGIAALALVASLFFLRFWRRSGDRFFVLFSAAFLLFAVSQVGVRVAGADEQNAIVYLPRLLGFLLIISAVVDKNRAR